MPDKSMSHDPEHCPKRADETHCNCWWDGDKPCCACGKNDPSDDGGCNVCGEPSECPHLCRTCRRERGCCDSQEAEMNDKLEALVAAARAVLPKKLPEKNSHNFTCVRWGDSSAPCNCETGKIYTLLAALDALDAESEVADEKDAILLGDDEAVKLVPSNIEEAVQQNERLKAIIRAHEKTARTKAVSAELVLLPDPGIAWRFVLCAPGCDEVALLNRARLELDRLANAFFEILAADETARGES